MENGIFENFQYTLQYTHVMQFCCSTVDGGRFWNIAQNTQPDSCKFSARICKWWWIVINLRYLKNLKIVLAS